MSRRLLMFLCQSHDCVITFTETQPFCDYYTGQPDFDLPLWPSD